MKARITSDGILRIAPESGLERYALCRWWEEFNTEGGRSALQVVTDALASDGEPSWGRAET